MNNAFTRDELINVLRGWHKNFKRVGRSHERNVQALAEAADMLGQGKWNSVKDRLPEKGERVLVSNGGFVCESYLNISGKWMRAGSEMFFMEPHYWMKMPEAPSKREEKK